MGKATESEQPPAHRWAWLKVYIITWLMVLPQRYTEQFIIYKVKKFFLNIAINKLLISRKPTSDKPGKQFRNSPFKLH